MLQAPRFKFVVISLLAFSPVLAGDKIPGQPFTRHATTDRFGREITFYLSEEPDASARLPLVVYIHGSGSQSLFGKRGDRIIPQAGQGTVADVARGRARLLIVEKPGVKFLDTPERGGGATEASEEFAREHTLDRWAEAVGAAIKSAREMPQIDPQRVVVIGHSEGGLVACKVAADNNFITHVACLAGGGPTQLFDLVELAREGKFAAPVSEDPEVRVRFIYDEYAKVVADPDSTTKQFMGHPNRRWSSFLASSPMQELARTDAKIYIAQGGKDAAVHPMSFHMLRAALFAQGKDVTVDFVTQADHSFNIVDESGKPVKSDWDGLIARILAWSAAPPATAPASNP